VIDKRRVEVILSDSFMHTATRIPYSYSTIRFSPECEHGLLLGDY
jgi:hypothetical protein